MRNAFGPFVLDNDGKVLRRGAETIPLGRRGLALLKTLLASGGAPVSKEQLREQVWPGVVVEDVNLTVQITHLRKALGPRDDGQDWVVTVPRFGYRLALGEEAEARRSPVPMLAVVPFHNLGDDGDRQYVADGLVDELISALSRFRGFGVFSRSAARESPGKARDADYLLDGSLRIVGDEIRVVTTLADWEGRTLWSDRFSGRMEALFAFQDHVVRKVASIIEPRIQATELSRASRRPPGNVDAYDLYLRALAKLYVFEQTANAEAIALLDRAIAIEPENGTYLGFASWALEMRVSLGWPTPSNSDRERCVDYANKAIALAPEDASVLAHCSIALQLIGLEYQRGLAIAERAATLNPNDPVALVNAGLAHLLGGSLETALERLHYCIALQPNDAFEAMGIIAMTYGALGQYEEALAWARRALAINANYQPSHWLAAVSASRLGRNEEAQAALTTLMACHPGLTIAKLMRVRPLDKSRDAYLLDGLRALGMPAA